MTTTAPVARSRSIPTPTCATTRLRRPSRRRQAADADHDAAPTAATRTSIRRPRPGRCRPGPCRCRRAPTVAAPAPAPRAGRPRVIRPAVPGSRCRSAGHRTDPAAAGPDGQRLPAAARGPAETRCAAEGSVGRQRRHDRADHRRARAVQCRRRGHRVHPRPDRHPLRGRTRAGRQGREDHRADPEHRLRRRHRQRPAAGADPRQVRGRHRGAELRPGDGPARRRARRARARGPITTRWSSGSARTSRATSSPPTSPRPRICWSPARPVPASPAS